MEEVKRASTKTQLRIGEVEIDIGLYKATGDPPRYTAFEQAGPNGHPLRAVAKADEAPVAEQAKADPLGVEPDEKPRSAPGEYRQVLVEEETGEEVPRDAVRTGIRLDDGRFIDLTAQLEKIEEDSRLEALEVLHFADRRRLPRERILASYFVGSGGEDAPATLRVLFEAMRAEDRIAVVRFTKRKGQTLGVLAPHASGAVVLHELAWAVQCRRPNARCLAHLRAEVTEGEVVAARNLIRAMPGRRDDLDALADRRWSAERELIARAESGELDDFEIEPEERPEEMRGLEELLAASIR